MVAAGQGLKGFGSAGGKSQQTGLFGNHFAGAGAKRGTSASTAWALVPPKPNELTPARAGPSVCGQGSSAVDHAQRQFVEGDVRVGLLEVQTRRNLAVLDGQRHLDQPGDAGGRLQVADVRLDRADQASMPFGPVLPQDRAEGAGLDRDRPAGVPVPWASTYWTCPGETPAWR